MSGIRDGTRVLVRVLSAVVAGAAVPVPVGKITPLFWLAIRTTIGCGQNLLILDVSARWGLLSSNQGNQGLFVANLGANYAAG